LTHKDESDTLKEWFRYNSYVRKKYLDALGKLPEQEITRDRGASFPSLIDIFAHVLDAYNIWYFRSGILSEENRELEGGIKSLEELREEEKKTDSAGMNFVEGLSAAALDKTFEISGEVNRWRFTYGQMLWHLVEEELQHRGELNALFWQIDVDPPVTDWIDWKTELGEIKPLSKT
jgi:uncharacterized damage-inducible protein DinB